MAARRSRRQADIDAIKNAILFLERLHKRWVDQGAQQSSLDPVEEVLLGLKQVLTRV